MEKSRYFQIEVKNIVEKVNVYLFLRKNGFSEHYLKNLRHKSDAIRVNNVTANAKTVLKNGDILEIDKNPSPSTSIKKVEKEIEVVFEDENYLLVNKPPLLATMPTKSHFDDNLAGRVVNYIDDENFTLRIFNRLDKDASGLVLISKDAITPQFTEILEKEYYAICNGVLKEEVVVEKPILTRVENGVNILKRVISLFGQYAKTRFVPIKNWKNYTLVKAEITKGRTHQIRLHSASISHSLIGDKVYGIEDEFSHAYLHLKKISFRHNLTGKTFEFEVDFPDDFKKFFNEKRP